MADEFTITTLLKYDKGSLKDTKNVSNLKVSQTGDGASGGIQNIGNTAPVAIDIGTISTLGMAFFLNSSLVNSVQIGSNVGSAGFGEFIRLEPGEPALMRLDLPAGGVLEARSNVGSVELQVKIYEE